jgi:hypothetical protein
MSPLVPRLYGEKYLYNIWRHRPADDIHIRGVLSSFYLQLRWDCGRWHSIYQYTAAYMLCTPPAFDHHPQAPYRSDQAMSSSVRLTIHIVDLCAGGRLSCPFIGMNMRAFALLGLLALVGSVAASLEAFESVKASDALSASSDDALALQNDGAYQVTQHLHALPLTPFLVKPVSHQIKGWSPTGPTLCCTLLKRGWSLVLIGWWSCFKDIVRVRILL